MNVIEGTVSRIIRGRVNLVEIKAQHTEIKCVTLGLPDFVESGARVKAVFKETNVLLCRESPYGIAFENCMQCTAVSVKKGQVLAEIKLDFFGAPLTAVLTAGAFDNIGFNEGIKLYALVGASDISIMEA
jgi:molybdopterin-binding protein